MVRKRRGDVGDFGHRAFEEPRGCRVTLAARRARKSRVGHLTNELVLERVLLLALEA